MGIPIFFVTLLSLAGEVDASIAVQVQNKTDAVEPQFKACSYITHDGVAIEVCCDGSSKSCEGTSENGDKYDCTVDDYGQFKCTRKSL